MNDALLHSASTLAFLDQEMELWGGRGIEIIFAFQTAVSYFNRFCEMGGHVDVINM